MLRELPEVRPEWQRGIEETVAERRSAWPGRSWRIAPLTAIAAAVACIMLGALANETRHRTASPSVSSMPVTHAEAQATLASAATTPLVRFDLVAPGATHVSIAGDFNEWSAESLPMHRSADGRTWQLEIRLVPGRYTYGFVVDGKLTTDPTAPRTASDDFGIPNSVRLVSRSGGDL